MGLVVLIMGAGPIGLVALLSAKAFGASKVIITGIRFGNLKRQKLNVLLKDLSNHRLKVAKELGADETVLVGQNANDEEISRKITEILGCQANVSIDCVGVEQTVRIAIQVINCVYYLSRLLFFFITTTLKATRAGGTAVIVGMGASEVNIPLSSALIREVDIKGVFRYVNE